MHVLFLSVKDSRRFQDKDIQQILFKETGSHELQQISGSGEKLSIKDAHKVLIDQQQNKPLTPQGQPSAVSGTRNLTG